MSVLAFDTLQEKENYSIKKLIVQGERSGRVIWSGIVKRFVAKPKTDTEVRAAVATATASSGQNNEAIIIQARLPYNKPKSFAHAVKLRVAYEEAKSTLESKKVDITAHTTEVEYGTFDFQVLPLRKLAKPLGKIENMEQFLRIPPESLTEVEVADNDIFIPRELR